MTAGSPSPLLLHQVSKKTETGGAGTRKIFQAMPSEQDPPHRATSQPLQGCAGGGDRVEGENKGSLSAAGYPILLCPDFHLGLLVPVLPRPSPSFSSPNQVCPLSSVVRAAAHQAGAGKGVAKENSKPASRRLPALPGSAHTLHSPGGGTGGRQRGGVHNARRMGGSPKFRGRGKEPATDPTGADQLRTCQKKDSRVPGNLQGETEELSTCVWRRGVGWPETLSSRARDPAAAAGGGAPLAEGPSPWAPTPRSRRAHVPF